MQSIKRTYNNLFSQILWNQIFFELLILFWFKNFLINKIVISTDTNVIYIYKNFSTMKI